MIPLFNSWFRNAELDEAREILRLMGEVFYDYSLYSDKVSFAGRYQFPLKLGGRPFIASGFLKVPIDTSLLPKAVFRQQLEDERLLTALRSATGRNVELAIGDRVVLPSLFGEVPKSGSGRFSLFSRSKGPDFAPFDLWFIIELDSSRLRGIPRMFPISDLPSPNPSHIISFPVGSVVSGGVRLVDFPNDIISLLVCGATGQGKSTYLRSVVRYISSYYHNVHFYLADFKETRVDFKMFSGSSFTTINTAEDIVLLIEAENSRRAKLLNASSSLNIFEYNNLSSDPLPYIFIVIDEMASWVTDLEVRYSKSDFNLWFRRLIRLVSVTRSSGIYWVLGTQRASIDIVPGSLKANLVGRFCFSMATATDSEVVFDSKDLAEYAVQVGCKGRGFGLFGDSFVEFQAPFYK